MVLSFDSDAAKWKYRDKPIATKGSHKQFSFQKKDAKWVDLNKYTLCGYGPSSSSFITAALEKKKATDS